MPQLISIAVEGPEQYIAIDTEGHVWSGHVAAAPGEAFVIGWKPVTSESGSGSEDLGTRDDVWSRRQTV